MGKYYVKSSKCDCEGCWSTLNSDYRMTMEKPCQKHRILEGNIIFYNLKPLLEHIITVNKLNIMFIRGIYQVKILNTIVTNNRKQLIKVEVNHDGELNMDNFDINKQMYFSDMNDEPMWKKIDDNKFELILLYGYVE